VKNTGQLSPISDSGTRTQTRPNAPQQEEEHHRRRTKTSKKKIVFVSANVFAHKKPCSTMAKIIHQTTRKMSQLCRKFAQVDVRWGVLKRVSFVGQFFRFIWNRILVCSVAGRPPHYRKLQLRDPSSSSPLVTDSDTFLAAAATCGYDSDSDLVNLKISLLGDCHIGKTTFVVRLVSILGYAYVCKRTIWIQDLVFWVEHKNFNFDVILKLFVG